jgi:hypothetical protein
MLAAIAAKDHASLGEILTSTTGIWHAPEVIADIIKADDVITLSLFIPYIKNYPHYILEEERKLYSGFAYDRRPLLSAAIKFNKPKIALHLALDPQTNILTGGELYTREYHEGLSFEKKEPFPSPIEQARQKGMTDVVAALAKRLIPLKELEIATLRQEAGLEPASQPASPAPQ